MSERFFILTPTPTDRTLTNDAGTYPVYLDASGNELKWSGKMALPKVGERIYMRVNSIGYGEIVGYSASHGYLGLMVKPENPPDWWKKQHKATVKEHREAVKLGPEKAKLERVREWPKWILDGICCVFGAEISKTEAA